MARLYISVNGDDVGSKIGDAIASNDHMALDQISNSLKDSHGMIEEWVTSKGGQVVSSSGDEGIYIVPEECLQELDQIRAKYSQMSGHTITVGVGSSMSDASKAMIYGKLNNKNQTVHYEPMIDDYLSNDPSSESEDMGIQDDQPIDPSQENNAVSEDQANQTLNEDQVSEMSQMNDATPSASGMDQSNGMNNDIVDRASTADPDSTMENPENEVGEVNDELQDDNSVDEYEKTPPETAVKEVIQQEEDKDISNQEGAEQVAKPNSGSIADKVGVVDNSNPAQDPAMGDQDQLQDMVGQDMDAAAQQETEPMMDEQSPMDPAAPTDEQVPPADPNQEGDVPPPTDPAAEGEVPPEEGQEPGAEVPPEDGEEVPPEDGDIDPAIAPEGDGEHDALKDSIMHCLHMFKEHKQDLDTLGTQNPQLHEALITMLQHMIEMGHILTEGESGQELQQDEAELGEYEESFPAADGEEVPPEDGEEVPPEDGEEVPPEDGDIEKEIDVHNEEEHEEDPKEDSAIEGDNDNKDATPDNSKPPFPTKEESPKEEKKDKEYKLEKK